jgi:hypothetical protein
MSLTKLSLAGNNLIISGQGEFGQYIPAGGGKTANLFLQCILPLLLRYVIEYAAAEVISFIRQVPKWDRTQSSSQGTSDSKIVPRRYTVKNATE